MTKSAADIPGLPHLEKATQRFEAELDAFAARRSAERNVVNLHDAMAYALGLDIEDPARRGKRIRPALCLLTAEALGAPPDRAVPFALAIELMHNFCLVHDDLEDGDVMRRGRDAVWVRYGAAHAINVGDYLLVQSQRALTGPTGDRLPPEMRLRLLRLLGETLDRTHIGQALDMNARGRRDIDVEGYMEIVREKTGFYMAAPIQGGAIAAGADETLIAAVGRMAELLGPMFQIMDDIIDLTEGKGREAAGADIREGKRSFLVAWAAERIEADERERLYEILDRPREATTGEDAAWARGLFERAGAIEAGRRRCRELYERSLEVMADFPPELAGTLGPVFASLAERRR